MTVLPVTARRGSKLAISLKRLLLRQRQAIVSSVARGLSMKAQGWALNVIVFAHTKVGWRHSH